MMGYFTDDENVVGRLDFRESVYGDPCANEGEAETGCLRVIQGLRLLA